MNIIFKKHLIIILLLLSCTIVKSQFVGEIINGPANVREEANGKILFSINHNIPVETTSTNNNWLEIGLWVKLTDEQAKKSIIKKGEKLTDAKGSELGIVISDFSPVTINEDNYAYITGYTFKDNIKPESYFENIFLLFLKPIISTRNLNDFETFIRKYEFESNNQFTDYTIYYVYENRINDPSPFYRLGLVFQNRTLIAVLHSRKLSIDGTTDYKLDRCFNCLIFNDFVKKAELVKIFNQFVNSVD